MGAQHWPTVRGIYKEVLVSGDLSFASRLPSGNHWNKLHLPHGRLVATNKTCRVLGWAALRPIAAHDLPAGVAEAHVYVSAAAQGQGIGRLLLAGLVRASEAHGIWTLQISTFAENRRCQRLYTGAGFRVVGRRERIGQHHGIWRDLVLLERRSTAIGTKDTPLFPVSLPQGASRVHHLQVSPR